MSEGIAQWLLQTGWGEGQRMALWTFHAISTSSSSFMDIWFIAISSSNISFNSDF